METKRDLDKFYVNIKRKNTTTKACLSDLSESELDDILNTLTIDDLKKAVKHLAITLKKMGQAFDIKKIY